MQMTSLHSSSFHSSFLLVSLTSFGRKEEMVKERFPRSQKSNRGHDRFKDLYAKDKDQRPATTPLTPELASRAPRQVAKSNTPSTDGTTTGTEITPVTKTPKKPHRPKTKKAKWSHVPSASDGEATHFENFENEGGAQLAVAKMKTRELQWKTKETTEVGTVDATTDSPESYRQEIDGTGGSAGSADELRLKPTELTQEDREITQDEPDQREIRNEPTLRLAPIPAAIQPSREVLTTVRLPPIVPSIPVIPSIPSKEEVKSPVVQTPQQPVKEPVKEVTKREQRKIPSVKPSAREQKKAIPSPIVSPQPPSSNNNNKSMREEATKKQTGVKKKEEPTSHNYVLAVKLMKILKRNNYLENALRFEDSEKVRKHFEANGFSQTPPPPIMSLLNRAMDFVLETVLFRADDLDTGITNELRVFIIKKQEARVLMLEVIFNRPDLMPTKWGGARAEVRSKNSKSRDGGKKGWFSFFRS